MDRQLIINLITYFQAKQKSTPEESKLLEQLKNELPYFPIISVCREDLENNGFDTSGIDDSQMAELAEQLHDEYCEQNFWTDMKTIAIERLKIPRAIRQSEPSDAEKTI